MAFADSNKVQLVVSTETVWGETPATPTMTQLRYKGEKLSYQKQTVQSDVIRPDRMRDALSQLGFFADGQIDFELATGQFDAMIQALMSSTFTTITSAGLTITVAVAGKTFTRSAGSFVTDGFLVGMWVKVAGATNAANNGLFEITAVTALVLTFANTTAVLVNETSGAAACTVSAKMIRNGVVAKSLLLEKQFTDIAQYVYYNGVRIDKMSLSLKAMSLILGSFNVIGKGAVASGATVSGSITPAAASNPMSASANVAQILRNGVAYAASIKALDVNVSNNLRKQEIVGSKQLGGVGYGFIDVNGKLEVYFQDLTVYQDLINHQNAKLSFRCTADDGTIMIFTIPNLYLVKGDPLAPAGNQDVMLSLDWSAVRDATTNCMLQIDEF